MTKTVNIAKAKATLSALVDEALAGEEVVIARAGKPCVTLTPTASREPRPFGIAKHWPKELADALLEPMDEEDLAWAEGYFQDKDGITLPPEEIERKRRALKRRKRR